MRRFLTKGFTLIEVLLALVVFSFAIIYLTNAFVNTLLSLKAITEENEELTDLRFVRSQIIQEPDLKEFEKGGEIKTVNSGMAHWKGEVEWTGVLDLFKVDLTIELPQPEGRKPYTQAETLLLLRPSWSDSEPGKRGQLKAEKQEQLEKTRASSGMRYITPTIQKSNNPAQKTNIPAKSGIGGKKK